MGDYATTAAMDLFTVEVGSRHDTELAALHGRRLVLAGEVDAGKRWNEAKLKAISGGDEISARFIRGNPFTFTPQFKLVMAGNNRPHMWNGGDAMRRRMNLIPFLFKPAIVDKELDAKLRRELPGILAWMIEGEVKRRLLGGLNPPTVIRNATDEYFADEDLIGRWIEERCVCQPAARSPVRTLYADLQSWAAMVGERWVPSLKVFSQRLALQRFKATRSGSRHDFLGIALCGGEERLAGLDDPMSDPAEDWPRE
jgi:putative DNA primase/helicase